MRDKKLVNGMCGHHRRVQKDRYLPLKTIYDKEERIESLFPLKLNASRTRERQVSHSISGLLRSTIKSIQKYGKVEPNQLDYTADFSPIEFQYHFEKLFVDGMSWDNYGEWHIDHIRPVASFNFDSTDHPDFKKCWALNNLQPLWAKDNMKKRNKWDGVVNA